MTGYARASGASAGVSFVVEIKSVNARGLDIRMRLAPGFDFLESALRRCIGQALSRGAVTLTLGVERETAAGRVMVNEHALGTVLAAMERLKGTVEASPPTLDGILALKGVLEQHDRPLDATAEEALEAAVLETAERAVADLVTARQDEGARLAAVLNARIDEIAALTKAAELHPGRSRDAILERIRQQLADLGAAGAGAAGAGLSDDRLTQEAMLLATRADIREELDRLVAHIGSARQLIAGGGAVGRKLDFLSQEFNREANTLCSKSNAVELTGIGLDLKAVIDQLREQVQNIE